MREVGGALRLEMTGLSAEMASRRAPVAGQSQNRRRDWGHRFLQVQGRCCLRCKIRIARCETSQNMVSIVVTGQRMEAGGQTSRRGLRGLSHSKGPPGILHGTKTFGMEHLVIMRPAWSSSHNELNLGSIREALEAFQRHKVSRMGRDHIGIAEDIGILYLSLLDRFLPRQIVKRSPDIGSVISGNVAFAERGESTPQGRAAGANARIVSP